MAVTEIKQQLSSYTPVEVTMKFDTIDDFRVFLAVVGNSTYVAHAIQGVSRYTEGIDSHNIKRIIDGFTPGTTYRDLCKIADRFI